MLKKIETDFLIIGQGIAGTLLHFCLKKQGQKVFVIDDNHNGSSSKVAAGGINPVTGKRFVKSWKIDRLIPAAKRIYSELEELLQIPIYTERTVYRILKNPGEENTWLARSADPGYAKYFIENPSSGTFKNHLKPVNSAGEIKNGGQVNLPKLIAAYREKLISGNEILNENFDYKKLIINDLGISYGNISAKKIIFCEGAAAVRNPFFNFLPFQTSKGEALILKIENSTLNKIIRHKISLLPFGENSYWAGSANSWETEDDTPTSEAKNELTERLEDFLQSPFKVTDHYAAIRPTTKDRRPLLGAHPDHPNLLIFNGLGTKGGSLAPWLAEVFCDWILEDKELEPEADIRRFR